MYDNNGDVFGFEYNGTPYYYVKNAQNDVFLILDETGEPVVIYQYDAWGKFGCYDATEENISSVNPITYRSYYVDLEMGFYMYYLNSRYYMADWGRFISADSYVQTGQGVLSNNMFAYCMNNPVNYVDPYGNCPYNGTAADFHRLEYGLPSLDCTCGYSEPSQVIYSNGQVIHIYKTENDADNVYSLTKKNVVRVVDSRKNTKPEENCFIIKDSFKINDKAIQTIVCSAIIDYNNSNPRDYNWNREIDTMLVEWDWHNSFYKYNIKPKSSQHVNFDMGTGTDSDIAIVQMGGYFYDHYCK